MGWSVNTMKAAVIHEPGGPEALKIESRPIPEPQPGEVLIEVKAFGLNRSELFTRRGLSPDVIFPRQSAWSRTLPARSSRKVTPSPPPWAAWDAISTAVTPSSPACR